MAIKLHPYKLGSASGKLLAQAMGQKLGRKIWRVKEQYKTKVRDTIINWGNSHSNVVCKFNPQNVVAMASNKLSAFGRFAQHNVPTVEWTTQVALVEPWLKEGCLVYARHLINGRGGDGIQLINSLEELKQARVAPLYSKYYPAKGEYRVHVCNGQVIDFARKRKKHGFPGNKYIRNHANGYVFSRIDVTLPQSVADAAVRAVTALGLHFGAVDVLHNEKKDQAAVLEVNTAPGLDNHTVMCYADALLRLAQ